MKIKSFLAVAAIASLAILSACNKEECHECHYDDANGDEVEIGEKCGDEIEDLEANGYEKDGVTYTVHCGEEH